MLLSAARDSLELWCVQDFMRNPHSFLLLYDICTGEELGRSITVMTYQFKCCLQNLAFIQGCVIMPLPFFCHILSSDDDVCVPLIAPPMCQWLVCSPPYHKRQATTTCCVSSHHSQLQIPQLVDQLRFDRVDILWLIELSTSFL